MWGPLAGQPTGGASRPHMSVTQAQLWWFAFWSLPKSVSSRITVIYFDEQVPLDGFLIKSSYRHEITKTHGTH